MAIRMGTTFMTRRVSLDDSHMLRTRKETEPSTPAPPVPEDHMVITVLNNNIV